MTRGAGAALGGGGGEGVVARVARRRTLSAMRLARSFARVASLFSRRARSSATSDDAEAVISGSLSNRPDARELPSHGASARARGRERDQPLRRNRVEDPSMGRSPPDAGRSVRGRCRRRARRRVGRDDSGARAGENIGALLAPKDRVLRDTGRRLFFLSAAAVAVVHFSLPPTFVAREVRPRVAIPEDPVERPLSPTT